MKTKTFTRLSTADNVTAQKLIKAPRNLIRLIKKCHRNLIGAQPTRVQTN